MEFIFLSSYFMVIYLLKNLIDVIKFIYNQYLLKCLFKFVFYYKTHTDY